MTPGVACGAAVADYGAMNQPAFRPIKKLATVTSILLAGQVGVALLGLVPESMYEEMASSLDDESLASLLTTVVFGIGALLALIAIWIGSIVVFLVWLNRAAWNIRALIPGGAFQFTPGWCVGWWFVPFANLLKPYQAVTEVAKASLAAATRDRNDPYATSWMSAAAPPVVGLWWAMWILSNFASNISSRQSSHGDASFVIDVVASLLHLVAAVACIMVVREVSEAQHDAHDRAAGDVRFAEGTAHVVS